MFEGVFCGLHVPAFSSCFRYPGPQNSAVTQFRPELKIGIGMYVFVVNRRKETGGKNLGGEGRVCSIYNP